MGNDRRTRRRKPRKKINHQMKGKLAGLFGAVLLALVCLLGRITYINATNGDKYKKQVLTQAQQKFENDVLPAKRGNIYDRNGNILATSNKVYNVILDCKTVNSDPVSYTHLDVYKRQFPGDSCRRKHLSYGYAGILVPVSYRYGRTGTEGLFSRVPKIR